VAACNFWRRASCGAGFSWLLAIFGAALRAAPEALRGLSVKGQTAPENLGISGHLLQTGLRRII